MSEQVIFIDEIGGVSSLDFKGRGIDLRQLGEARIERTTEILWNQGAQKWYIKYLTGRKSGTLATVGDWTLFGNGSAVIFGEDGELLFDEYDEAVQHEIVLVQAMREEDPELI